MAQEIVDVSGQTGNQILQTLNKRGVQTSLLNLVQSTGAESARNIPRFIIVEDGQVKGGTDTQPQTAMDLSATDIVDTGGQTQTIQRQPVRRSPQLPTSQTDKVADLKLINPDSSLILKRLTEVKEGRGLTGLVNVGKKMLLDAAPKIMPM